MNNFIMQLKIEKSKAENDLKEISIKITRLLNEIAEKSCPFFDDFSEIDALGIEQAADELLLTQKKAVEVQNKIAKIKKELGE